MILFYTLSILFVFSIAIILAKLIPLSRFYKWISMVIIIAGTYCIYSYVGALPEIKQYQSSQLQSTKVAELLQSMDGKQGLIKRLKERLEKEPNSAQGHYLLAKLLASEGKWNEATVYFHTAKSIQPDNIAYQVNYAYSLWQMNQNQFNDEIRTIFKGLLEQNPNQVDALNMLAMDAYQSKNYTQAIVYWRQLLKLAPPNSEDAKVIEDAIQKAQDSQQNE